MTKADKIMKLLDDKIKTAQVYQNKLTLIKFKKSVLKMVK